MKCLVTNQSYSLYFMLFPLQMNHAMNKDELPSENRKGLDRNRFDCFQTNKDCVM